MTFSIFLTQKNNGRDFFLPLSILCVNQIHIYNFSCSCLYVIHCTDPRHLVGAFEFLRYAFFFGKLLYQSKEQFLRLFVYISKITV